MIPASGIGPLHLGNLWILDLHAPVLDRPVPRIWVTFGEMSLRVCTPIWLTRSIGMRYSLFVI